MTQAAPDAWPCWAYSNHDTVRHITRWRLSDDAARVYTSLLMCLRGSLCLYQGEELGLPEAEIAFEDLQDPYGIEFWPEFKGRDGCRTPMVWVTDNASGGFTTGKPWLPVTAPHLPRSVAAQEADAGSLLHHYRRALAFRRAHPVLKGGAMSAVSVSGDAAWFTRTGDETILVAVNLGEGTARVDLPPGNWVPIGAELGSTPPEGGTVTLGPWGLCLAQAT
jgi:alpha-glucosidase